MLVRLFTCFAKYGSFPSQTCEVLQYCGVLQYCAKPCRNTELASAVELPFEMRAVPKGGLGKADTTLDPTIPHPPMVTQPQAEPQTKSHPQPFAKSHTEMNLWS